VRASSQFSVLPLSFGLLLITSLYLHCSEGYKRHHASWHCTYMMLYVYCLFIYFSGSEYSAKLYDDKLIMNCKGCRRKESCMTLYKPQKEVPCTVEITALNTAPCLPTFAFPSYHCKALVTNNGFVVTATNMEVTK